MHKVENSDGHDYIRIQTKLDNIQDSMNNFEWNIENYCEFLKHEIEINVDSIIDKIQRQRIYLFETIDKYKYECVKKFKENQNERKNFQNFIRDVQIKLEDWKKNGTEKIQAIENELKVQELYYEKFLKSFFNLNYKESDVALPENLCGRIYFTDNNSNELQYCLDINRLHELENPDRVSCILEFDLDRDVNPYCKNIVSIGNKELLIWLTTVDSLDFIQMDTHIKIVSESGLLLREKSISSLGLKHCNLVAKDLLVMIFEDRLNCMDNISSFDINLDLINSLELSYEVQSMSVYDKRIYLLTLNFCSVKIFDINLNNIGDLDFIASSASIIIQNGFLFAEHEISHYIDVYDIIAQQTVNQIKLDLPSNTTCTNLVKYIDQLERIIVIDQDNRDTRVYVYSKRGELLFKKKFYAQGVYCITQCGHIIIYDDFSKELTKF